MLSFLVYMTNGAKPAIRSKFSFSTPSSSSGTGYIFVFKTFAATSNSIQGSANNQEHKYFHCGSARTLIKCTHVITQVTWLCCSMLPHISNKCSEPGKVLWTELNILVVAVLSPKRGHRVLGSCMKCTSR